MRILGIETSCDETAAAVVEGEETERLSDGVIKLNVLSNVVASQIKIHEKTGGVVPEVAARAHVEKILPVVKIAMHNAECRMQNLGSDIDAIAVTAGPGLTTSLLVGVEVARTLSYLWKKPVAAVNHLAGHIYANWLPSFRHSEEPRDEESRTNARARIRERSFALRRMTEVEFPILCLIVSGGHTELVLMKKHLDFKVIGSTRDDAAGEAFDKVAKMLNLRYPGGPEVARLAEQFTVDSSQSTVTFPRPMIRQKGDFSAKSGPASGWDFSFSGLKTAVLYYLKSKNYLQQNKMRPHLKMLRGVLPEICYEFQEAVVDVLVSKTIRAAKKYKVKTVLLGGGVAANTRLRQRLVEAIRRELPTTSYVLPTLAYTGDNAAMIAAAGYFMARAKQFTPWEKLEVDPNWELGQKFRPLPR